MLRLSFSMEYIIVKTKYHENNVTSKYETCADQSSNEKVVLQNNKDESVNTGNMAEQKECKCNCTYLDLLLYINAKLSIT